MSEEIVEVKPVEELITYYEEQAEKTGLPVGELMLVDVYCLSEEIEKYSWVELVEIAKEREEEAIGFSREGVKK